MDIDTMARSFAEEAVKARRANAGAQVAAAEAERKAEQVSLLYAAANLAASAAAGNDDDELKEFLEDLVNQAKVVISLH